MEVGVERHRAEPGARQRRLAEAKAEARAANRVENADFVAAIGAGDDTSGLVGARRRRPPGSPLSGASAHSVPAIATVSLSDGRQRPSFRAVASHRPYGAESSRGRAPPVKPRVGPPNRVETAGPAALHAPKAPRISRYARTIIVRGGRTSGPRRSHGGKRILPAGRGLRAREDAGSLALRAKTHSRRTAKEHPMPHLTVNGRSRFVDSPDDTPLLWAIREDLRLTGTKYGCGVGLCGVVHRAHRRRRHPLLPDRGRRRRGAAPSPPSRAWTAPTAIPSSAPGWRPSCRNAAIASRARSCRRRPSSPPTPIPPIPRSWRPWTAICAAAPPTATSSARVRRAAEIAREET